jgi:hypothetical protein
VEEMPNPPIFKEAERPVFISQTTKIRANIVEIDVEFAMPL